MLFMYLFCVPYSILYIFSLLFSFFFFNDTATTEIYTLSLHDALPISIMHRQEVLLPFKNHPRFSELLENIRSEEHTSELQSRPHLVCRLLLEKKKKKHKLKK